MIAVGSNPTEFRRSITPPPNTIQTIVFTGIEFELFAPFGKGAEVHEALLREIERGSTQNLGS